VGKSSEKEPSIIISKNKNRLQDIKTRQKLHQKEKPEINNKEAHQVNGSSHKDELITRSPETKIRKGY
jgi:hypothetical protein